MGRPKITIGRDDYAKWGKLVKTWATGRNYVDHAMSEENPVPTQKEMPPKFPRPTSFEDFVNQCRLAGVGLVFDDGSNTPVQPGDGVGLIVAQGDCDVFVLRLPPLEILLEYEARFIAGPYPLPKFYLDLYDGTPPANDALDTKVEKMMFHAQRVGEYTLNTCG